MSNLIASGWVHDGETSIDVPFVVEDAHHDVDFDIFDAADVARDFPWKLSVGSPCCAHTEEGGVSDGLCIGRDSIVFLPGEVDVS